VIAIILGVSWSSVRIPPLTKDITDRIPLPVHDPSIPSLLFGLPYTLAQGRWVHVSFGQSRSTLHFPDLPVIGRTCIDGFTNDDLVQWDPSIGVHLHD
jgi:hypothetical protein